MCGSSQQTDWSVGALFACGRPAATVGRYGSAGSDTGRTDPEIAYEVDAGRAIEAKEVPFVIGVLAHLTGHTVVGPAGAFVDVDAGSFDATMRTVGPSLRLAAPAGEADAPEVLVDFAFECLEDFRPDRIARQAAPALLQARQDLTALVLYLDGNVSGRRALESLLDEGHGWQLRDRIEEGASMEPFAALIEAFGLQTPPARETVARALRYLATSPDTWKVTGSAVDSSQVIDHLIRGIDDRLGRLVSAILHHPDFQCLERSWMGVHRLVQAARDSSVRIRIRSTSRDELAEAAVLRDELRAAEERGEWSACMICDLYIASKSEDVEVLKKLGEIGTAHHCVFVVGAGAGLVGTANWSQLPSATHVSAAAARENLAAWNALRAAEGSRYLCAVAPAFIGREPYTLEPHSSGFDFVERIERHEDRCWVNAAFAVGTLIARAQARYGWPARICGVEWGTLTLPLGSPAVERERSWTVTEGPIGRAQADELSKLGVTPFRPARQTRGDVLSNRLDAPGERQTAGRRIASGRLGRHSLRPDREPIRPRHDRAVLCPWP